MTPGLAPGPLAAQVESITLAEFLSMMSFLRGCSRIAAVLVTILIVAPGFERATRAAPSCAYPRCPLPNYTRGDVLTTSKSVVCNRSTKVVRNVPPALKQQIFAEYHINAPQFVAFEDLVQPGAPLNGARLMVENELAESHIDPNAPGSPGPSGAQYEIDHFIPLELGGSNDPENLWPQSYVIPWGAHVKDALENKLHRMVCAGQISLTNAQAAIKTNWLQAYDKYVAGGG